MGVTKKPGSTAARKARKGEQSDKRVEYELQRVGMARERLAAGTAAPEKGLGERLKIARESAQLSQLGLSTLTKKMDPDGKGISRTVLVGYEQGKFLPGARELRVLHDALGLAPNVLVLGTPSPISRDRPVGSHTTEKELLARARGKLKKLLPHQLEALVTILSAVAPDLDDLQAEALAMEKDFLRDAVIDAAKKDSPRS